jgi:hypothetical protein
MEYLEMSRNEIRDIVNRGGDKKRKLDKVVADYLDTLDLSEVARDVIAQTGINDMAETFAGLFTVEEAEETAAEISGNYSYLHLEGTKWGDLSPERKDALSESGTAVNAFDSEPIREGGECTIDLLFPFAVPGRVLNAGTDLEEIVIDDDATIYSTI